MTCFIWFVLAGGGCLTFLDFLLGLVGLCLICCDLVGVGSAWLRLYCVVVICFDEFVRCDLF